MGMTDQDRTALHRRDWEKDATGPLNGVRVLDLSRLFAGNVLSQQLGDFGVTFLGALQGRGAHGLCVPGDVGWVGQAAAASPSMRISASALRAACFISPWSEE